MFRRRNGNKKSTTAEGPSAEANIIKIIKEGDLDRLKEIIENNPGCLNQWLEWGNERSVCSVNYHTGNILHVAAYFNQPKIIDFLVNEKGMRVDQPNQLSQRTPLHFAGETDSYEAADLLLQLGANPALNCLNGTTFETCKYGRTKELLRPYHEEQLRRDAIAKAEGTWTSVLPEEIVHEHEPPGQSNRITDIFNFATESWVSIAKDLQDGQMAKETKSFDYEKDGKTINEAREQLDKLQGGVPPEASTTEEKTTVTEQQPEPREQPRSPAITFGSPK